MMYKGKKGVRKLKISTWLRINMKYWFAKLAIVGIVFADHCEKATMIQMAAVFLYAAFCAWIGTLNYYAADTTKEMETKKESPHKN
jgi:hypothetical protein